MLWVPFLRAEPSTAVGGQALVLGVRMTSGKHVSMGLEIGQRNDVHGEAQRVVQLGGSVPW